MKRNFVQTLCTLGAACCLLVGTAQAQELFDFEGAAGDGADWNGALDEFSNSGNYTLTGTGGLQENATTTFIFHNDPLLAPGDPNPQQANLQVLDLADAVQNFTVNSLDWRAGDFNGGNTASLVGYDGATEIWRIDGPQNLDPPTTFTAPTSGDFNTPVNSIVWDIPDYMDEVFGHTLDNVDVTIAAPPAGLETFDFEGPAGDGADWNGAIDEVSNSGNYTLTGIGGIQENATTAFIFHNDPLLAPGALNPQQAEMQVLDLADNPQDFTVFSLDWRAGDFNGGTTASLVGYSGGAGGTEEWRIDGPFNLSPAVTISSPTSGSFGNTIDTIVWDIPDYMDEVFGHTIDNVNVILAGGPTPIPGDANGDGIVDLLDLDILGTNFGLTPATFADGDFNGDGIVDLLDLDILGSNFGATSPSASVPEPTALALAALATCCLIRRRK